MLDARKLQAITLLVIGRTRQDVAKALDVDARTVWEWAHDPEFDYELKRRVQESSECVMRRQQEYALRGLDLLYHAMMNEALTWPVRIRAAGALVRSLPPMSQFSPMYGSYPAIDVEGSREELLERLVKRKVTPLPNSEVDSSGE